MHCKQCGFANGEDDHRCLHCGRRLAGIVIAAPPGYSGANALALAPVFDPAFNPDATQDFIPVSAGAAPPAQPPLFPVSHHNVIPFDRLQRQVAERAVVSQPAPPAPATFPAPPAASQVAPPRLPPRKESRTAGEQSSLDFVQSASVHRTLKNDVPAQVYCEQPVATPQHRFFACAVDAAMILLGFGVFAGVVAASGSGFGAGSTFWIVLGLSFMLLSLFYGLIWAIAGRETAGMDWTDLQLITFDGFPVDARSRAIRFASTWLSFCSGGLGLVWAVADEENLTWHDHISKTFPTFREVPRNFVRRR
ncbi:MAG: RDD family protein [Acidobacteriota bacterium]